MSLSEREIRTIVDRITAELDRGGRATPGSAPARPSAASAHPAPASQRARHTGGSLGIYETVDEAVAAARSAQRGIRTLELRDKIIANQRKRLSEVAASLAEDAVAETKLGNVRSKTLKNQLVIDRTPAPRTSIPRSSPGITA